MCIRDSPYTWGLLSAMPDLDTADERLYTIPGSPPNLLHEKAGDAFAPVSYTHLSLPSPTPVRAQS